MMLITYHLDEHDTMIVEVSVVAYYYVIITATIILIVCVVVELYS